MSGIYKIINKINGKYYVGSTNDFKWREYQHKWALNQNKHTNPHLQNSWNKYGKDNFSFIIIESNIPKNELLMVEQKYLDISKNEQNKCYNKNFLADRIEMTEEIIKKSSSTRKLKHRKVSPEQIQKQKQKMLEYWTEERKKEHQEKMKLWFYSKSKELQDEMRSGNKWWLNKEYKEKHLKNTRKSLTTERIEKQRNSINRYYEKNNSKKSIIKEIISPENNIVKINGLNNFCKKYHLDRNGIINVIDGNKKHHKGWHIDSEFIFIPDLFKKLISPTGDIYEFSSILKFCREHKLNCGGIKNVLNGKYKHHKLWRLPHVSLEEAIINKCSVYKNIQFKFPDGHIERILDNNQFCKKYRYSSKYLYKFLKNKLVGDLFHGLELVSK